MRRPSILIVDDEPDVREVLEEYFVAHGYAAIGAESAGAAKSDCRCSSLSTSRWSTSTCPARMVSVSRGTFANVTRSSRSSC